MKTSDIKEIQKAQLYIMDKIHELCVENDLKYYLIGGSAIGAVRHKGFVPWDVDIDIAMPRDDYNKLIEISSHELPDDLMVCTHKNNPYLLSPHALVILKNSKIIFKNDKLNRQIDLAGIYVDVLPLDKVPINICLREKQRKRLLSLRNLMEFRMMRYYESDSRLKRIVKKILIPCLYKIPMSLITSKQQEVAQWGNNQLVHNEICSMLSHYKYDKLCMPKEWFAEPVLMAFEGREYFVPTDVNSYLHKLFGDYMKLPSKQEQIRYQNLISSAEFNIPI